MDDNLNLEERVNAFNLLELPSQPKFMHMGTSQLIHDLLSEVKRLRSLTKNLLAMHEVKRSFSAARPLQTGSRLS